MAFGTGTSPALNVEEYSKDGALGGIGAPV
jgi:hypothetical protein